MKTFFAILLSLQVALGSYVPVANNTVPKGSTTNGLQNSSVTDDGTTVQTSELLNGEADTINTTTTTRHKVANATAALVGQQQISPAIELTGQGWGNVGAASQSGQLWLENFVLKDSTVANNLRISYSENGGAQTTLLQVTPQVGTHTSAAMYLGSITPSSSNFLIKRDSSANVTINSTLTSAAVILAVNAVNWFQVLPNDDRMPSATVLEWNSDTGLFRAAAGEIDVTNGVSTAGCSTAANCRDLRLRSLVGGGSVPSISGCGAGTQVGGATIGSFNSGTTGTCTVTLTFLTTAPNAWFCDAQNQTTFASFANIMFQNGGSTTTAVLTGTTVSGDVIKFACFAY